MGTNSEGAQRTTQNKFKGSYGLCLLTSTSPCAISGFCPTVAFQLCSTNGGCVSWSWLCCYTRPIHQHMQQCAEVHTEEQIQAGSYTNVHVISKALTITALVALVYEGGSAANCGGWAAPKHLVLRVIVVEHWMSQEGGRALERCWYDAVNLHMIRILSVEQREVAASSLSTCYCGACHCEKHLCCIR
jgi:hypothetical protein